MGNERVTSIGWVQSFKDWWNEPSFRRKYNSCDDPRYPILRYKNLYLEYELFKSVLSEDVHLVPPENPHFHSESVPEASSETIENHHSVNISSTSSTGFLDLAINGSLCAKLIEQCNIASHNPLEQDYIGQFIDTEIDGTILHEFCLSSKQPVDDGHIVFIHGYMAALGFFVTNLEPLVKSAPGLTIHAIDLHGFGNSSRPPFPSAWLQDPVDRIQEIKQILQIESWFIDAIEKWRIKRGINKFRLIGHSMGAYIASCYLMKYNTPQNSLPVLQVVLASPMGSESSAFSLINHPDMQHKWSVSSGLSDDFPLDDLNLEINEELKELWRSIGQPKFPSSLVLKNIWKYHLSPFQILQYLGPFYSKLLSYWTFARFKNITTKRNLDLKLRLKLHEYCHSIFDQYQRSGELAITKLVNCRILAKLPLCDRGFAKYLVENSIEVLWLYGEHDWMNENGGFYIHSEIQKLNSRLSKYHIVKNAAHHLYMDNLEKFNQYVIDFFSMK
jgi:pimeloyl-ACP methyl ester carboxylesterase